MSTHVARIPFACPGCLDYGGDCGMKHYAEVTEHNSACVTTIRIFKSKLTLPECRVIGAGDDGAEEVQSICIEWSAKDALLKAFEKVDS